jgi:hypothetical protein
MVVEMQQEVAQPQYKISDADKERQQRIAASWQAYDGELDPPLIPMPGEPDDNVVGNYIEDKVDAGVQFLFGKEVEISLDESAPQEAQDFIDRIWGEKETRIPLLQGLAYNGAMAGQAFIRIVPTDDKSFRLVEVDPSTIFVQTAPQDCNTVELFCIEYCVEGDALDARNKPLRTFYREEISRVDPQQDDPDSQNAMQDMDTTWLVQHWTRIGDKGPWQSAGDPIVWPYPFPPIFSNQNMKRPNSFWGKPDVTKNLIGLNKALNLGDSNINRILKLYASPLITATGVGDTIMDIRPGRIQGLPPEGKLDALALTTDLANALTFAGRIQSRIDEQTAVPGIVTGRESAMPKGNISGIAIELAHMSIIKRTDLKRCLYGKLIIDVTTALLILGGFSPDIKATLNWQNPLPNDDLATAQAAVVKGQVGVSEQTLLEEMGYDAKEEQKRKQAESEAKMAMLPPALQQAPQDAQGPDQQQQFGGQE